MARAAILCMTLALSGAACERCGEDRGEETPSGTEGAEAAPRTAVVQGVVRLAPGAELPSQPPERGPGDRRPAPPESCPPPRVTDRQPVTLGGARGLEGVMVAASEFDAATPHEPTTHQVLIRDCRLTPRLVVATRGDSVELKNETDYPFMPIFGGGGLAQALLLGETRTVPLDQGGVSTFTCTFTAPCGTTDVITLYHPVHTTTGEAGAFRLEVPAGEEIELHAWHPLFEETGTTLTLEPGETRRVELELAPAAIVAPAPAEVDPAGPTEGEGQPAADDTLF